VKIEFLEPAKIEFDNAVSYYEGEQEGLGIRFKNEIRSSIDRVIKFPYLYPIIEDSIRKCVAHSFPYTIFYVIENETIYVYAIANHFRDPSILADRFKEKEK